MFKILHLKLICIKIFLNYKQLIMKKFKRTIIVYSNASKMGHRDLYETHFYSNMEKYFNVIWLFDGEPIKNFKKKRKNYFVIKLKQNIRFLFWTYLFYLEEIIIKKKQHPNIYKNSRLYVNKLHKNIIEIIYLLKLDKIVKLLFDFILYKTTENYNFFSNADFFISISTGKDLLADDLARNAKKKNIPYFFIPAGWDHISGKPMLVRPDKIMVWGKQTKQLCKNIHNFKSEIIGSFKFDIYKKNISKIHALKKLKLDHNFKYILVCGSVVVFNEHKLINKILKYLKNKKMKKYRIIYKPHPFAMKRIFDEKINFASPNKVIFSHKIKKEFKLEDYPYLLKSMEGIITPYSTMIVESLYNKVPCMAVGYTEKNQYGFDWRLHTVVAPHLKILKNKKFIINCLDENMFTKKFEEFLKVTSNKKLNLPMKKFTDQIVYTSDKTFNHRIIEKIQKFSSDS